MNWLKRISDGPAHSALAGLVEQGGAVAARGLVGSSAVVIAAALARRTGRPMVVVTAHLDEADEAADELAALGVRAEKFPAMEILPGETSVSSELLAERLTVVRRLVDGAVPPVIVTPIHALMQEVPPAGELERLMRVLRVGLHSRLQAFDRRGQVAVLQEPEPLLERAPRLRRRRPGDDQQQAAGQPAAVSVDHSPMSSDTSKIRSACSSR